MHTSPNIICNFDISRPLYKSTQEQTAEWLIAAHVKAEETSQQSTIEQLKKFQEEIRQQMLRVGCKPGIIEQRGHEIDDFLHRDWNLMQVYNLEKNPQGASLQERQAIHQEIVERNFNKLYPSSNLPPRDLIHVSCTGYASPSAPQKIATTHQWGDFTTITHAYHMGCYAAIPAIRMATAFSAWHKERCDIVHTELCSLHINPLQHESDLLVAQSLFADGSIKYSVLPESCFTNKSSKKPYLKILGIYERIIPNSLNAIQWRLGNWGFQFGLAKETPALIAPALQGYLHALCEKANLDVDDIIRNAIFAIHPGGPKILQYVQKMFGLRDEQIQTSKVIFQQCGNMSSATLPHIWEKICSEETVANGTKIVSLGFGPGVTIAGIILEKG